MLSLSLPLEDDVEPPAEVVAVVPAKVTLIKQRVSALTVIAAAAAAPRAAALTQQKKRKKR